MTLKGGKALAFPSIRSLPWYEGLGELHLPTSKTIAAVDTLFL